jgi:hypothetical protein
MTTTVRNPTMVAECGCPYDPEYDADSLGWHLAKNHPDLSRAKAACLIDDELLDERDQGPRRTRPRTDRYQASPQRWEPKIRIP